MTKPGGPIAWFAELDRLLRGEATRPSTLQKGEVDIPVGGLAVVAVLLGAVAGACMGSFAVTHEGGTGPIQIAASAIKVPLLFALTLVVTFPSLYVFNALVGSRLGFRSLLRLLVAATAVMLTVLASLGPIVAFFSVVTESYAFVLLMNVAAFGVAGSLGLGFLLQTLHRLSLALERQWRASPATRAEPGTPPDTLQRLSEELERESGRPAEPGGALEPYQRPPDRQVRMVFRCWIVLFGLVGAQMAWVLRPFVGNPNQPFTWLRPRQSNFFEAVLNALGQMFGA